MLLEFKINQIIPDLVSESVATLDDTLLIILLRCLARKSMKKENRKETNFVQANWKVNKTLFIHLQTKASMYNRLMP